MKRDEKRHPLLFLNDAGLTFPMKRQHLGMGSRITDGISVIMTAMMTTSRFKEASY